jgi:transposase
MEHIAIDLGGRESQICIRARDGQVVEEKRCATKSLGKYLATRPKSRVIVETCSEAFGVADAALNVGHEVRVVPATLVRSLGVGARGTKTDRRDAQILSEVSCRIDLPSVHIPGQESRRRKSTCGMRDSLVKARTQLSNCVRGWLRSQGRSVRTGSIETFPRRVREEAGDVPTEVERLLCVVDDLTKKIVEAEKEIEKEARGDATCQRLMTVPGVGPNTALRFVAALDEINRFEGAHKVEAYLGLVPGENSSSERKRRTGITKAGSSALRHTLVQAAWAARRCRRQDPMQRWSIEVEKRRGKRVALMALARKLAGILYALWRNGTRYEPTRGARMEPAA